MPSFDVISEVDKHEVTNAVDQANRELTTRFDFRGVNAAFKEVEDGVELQAEVDFQLNQMLDIFWAKAVKRGLEVRSFEIDDSFALGKLVKQRLTIKQGIPTQTGKDIIKDVKQKKFKVQTSLQGDQVRVTGKKRDDLQAVIAHLKAEDFGQPLQFKNFRD